MDQRIKKKPKQITDSALPKYKKYVQGRLSKIQPLLRKYALGDFSKAVSIPEQEDEFTELFVGLNLMVEDIKDLMDEIQQTQEKYRTLVNTSTNPITMYDLKNRIVLINSAGARNLGGEPKDLVGKSMRETFGASAIEYEKRNKKIARSGKGASYEDMVALPAGNLWFLSNLQPIKNKKGRVIAIMIVSQDITKLKKAEQILTRDKKELEKIILKRVKELSNVYKKLEASKRLADIGTLAATIAHELRNPLGVIKTAVFNLKRKSSDKNLTKHFLNIEKKVIEGEAIIKNLLSYSRIKTPSFINVSINKVINDSITNCNKKYAGQKVVARLSKAPGYEVITQADELQLNEVFYNLLENAVQSFLGGGGRIDVSIEVIKNNCKIIFSDNGQGIDEEAYARIFDPFFTTRARGTGLGLTICREIINLHDGTIDIQSKKGKGTKVTVNLPLKR